MVSSVLIIPSSLLPFFGLDYAVSLCAMVSSVPLFPSSLLPFYELDYAVSLCAMVSSAVDCPFPLPFFPFFFGQDYAVSLCAMLSTVLLAAQWGTFPLFLVPLVAHGLHLTDK